MPLDLALLSHEHPDLGLLHFQTACSTACLCCAHELARLRSLACVALHITYSPIANMLAAAICCSLRVVDHAKLPKLQPFALLWE